MKKSIAKEFRKIKMRISADDYNDQKQSNLSIQLAIVLESQLEILLVMDSNLRMHSHFDK